MLDLPNYVKCYVHICWYNFHLKFQSRLDYLLAIINLITHFNLMKQLLFALSASSIDYYSIQIFISIIALMFIRKVFTWNQFNQLNVLNITLTSTLIAFFIVLIPFRLSLILAKLSTRNIQLYQMATISSWAIFAFCLLLLFLSFVVIIAVVSFLIITRPPWQSPLGVWGICGFHLIGVVFICVHLNNILQCI